jgi:predicted kinase
MSNKLICTRGYSGAGKTTWANEWLAEAPDSRVITSRDDLRETLFRDEGILSSDKEDMITKIQQGIVQTALEAGKDVVIHDTHLRARYLRDWADFANDMGADFEVKDFKTSVHDCLIRDGKRFHNGERYVGDEVIENQAKRFPFKNWKDIKPRQNVDLSNMVPYQIDHALQYVVICDIDGTVADMNGVRGPFDLTKVSGDLPKEEIINIVRLLEKEYKVIFFSGREDSCYVDTYHWLEDHLYLELPIELHMRPSGDYRPDSIVKYEMFEQHIRGNYNVAAVIDDRLQVVRMWHKLGVPVFRVGDPDAKF